MTIISLNQLRYVFRCQNYDPFFHTSRSNLFIIKFMLYLTKNYKFFIYVSLKWCPNVLNELFASVDRGRVVGGLPDVVTIMEKKVAFPLLFPCSLELTF